MSSSSSNPLQISTAAFKDQVRRHCEQRCASNLATSAPQANHPFSCQPKFYEHGAKIASGPAKEPRRSSNGQVRPVFAGKDPFTGPPPTMIPQHIKPKSGKHPAFNELRRSSDGQLQPMLAGKDPRFAGPPPVMIPRHMQQASGMGPTFNAALRRSSDGQLRPMFAGQDPFVGPPPMMIPKHVAQKQDETAEVKVSQKEFQVDMDVAAYAPEELDVKIVGDHVVIRGRHAEENRGENTNISREFSRRYTLPEDVIAEEVSVFLAKSGMLSVKVPRKAAVEEKKSAKRKGKVKFQDSQ